jgi:hypothetical protein
MYIPLTFEGALQKCLFASGGYEGYFISGSQQWKYHWFTGSSDLIVQKGTIDNVQIYVVGGGGGGARGTANTTPAAGGGGGGINFTTTARLFQGAYAVSVGAGGSSQLTQNSNGFNGISSSFIGANINMVIGGGGGGTWGNTGVGGTSGNGFSGGTSNSENGGGGGGSTAVGDNATLIKAGNGGAGNIFSIAEFENGFGCGGGGYAESTSDEKGFSCNGVEFGAGGEGNGSPGAGANRYGMGGGGGGNYGAEGGSGSVIIQYPIYDYCSNYFNQTGSCGCREITFDTTDPLNYYPQLTGSFIYQPCGENKFVSGSLISYGPLTVCAVSNSYYSYTIGDTVDPIVVTSRAGFVNSDFVPNAPECVSASLVPIACSIENFVPTCTSSVVTIYTPSGSGGNQSDFYYVAKNESTHSVYTSTSNRVKYICISTGSSYAGNLIYPQLLTGDFAALYNTVSCNTITLIADWAGKSPSITSQTTYTYYQCNGDRTSVTLSRPSTNYTGQLSASFCRDMNTPAFFTRSGTSLPNETFISGSSCISTVFDTGSCGCP